MVYTVSRFLVFLCWFHGKFLSYIAATDWLCEASQAVSTVCLAGWCFSCKTSILWFLWPGIPFISTSSVSLAPSSCKLFRDGSWFFFLYSWLKLNWNSRTESAVERVLSQAEYKSHDIFCQWYPLLCFSPNHQVITLGLTVLSFAAGFSQCLPREALW